MISKTRTRYTAKNSLISEMAIICVVSVTYFNVSTDFLREVENDMKVADEGVSLLYKLASKLYNNLPILPVKPELMFSTDDTVNFVYDGLGNDKDKCRLVTSKAIAKTGTRSRYAIDESKKGVVCG